MVAETVCLQLHLSVMKPGWGKPSENSVWSSQATPMLPCLPGRREEFLAAEGAALQGGF